MTDRTVLLEAIATDIRERLVREPAGGMGHDPAARIAALVDDEAAALGPADRAELRRIVAERSFGLGPLEVLLADREVDEIMVNGVGPGSVWIERGGRVEPVPDVCFVVPEELRHAIERMLAPLGRRVDEAEPMCDARLGDGSRVNVVIPPLAVDGPLLTIRRFRPRGLGPDELVALGTWTPEVRDLLAAAVRERLSILVSGGTGSGKTTTLGALAVSIPAAERVVTIEDTAELRLPRSHVVRLEARPPNLEGRGEVTIRALVRNALRMRPDRIVVGEVRGPEALDMLGAMSTGHDGSLATVHAGSPQEALRRVETLALMADVGLPHAAIREQVAGAVDLVVHLARAGDGGRRVRSVAEVTGITGGEVVLREVYAQGPEGATRLTVPRDGRLAEALGR